MLLVQVPERAQITIQSRVRKALGIKEGDYLEAELAENKTVLVPKTLIDEAASCYFIKEGPGNAQRGFTGRQKGVTLKIQKCGTTN